MSPVSTLFDVENQDGTPPLRIGNVMLKWECTIMQANVYTPEMSQPKFVVRANRCKIQNCCPMHCEGMDQLEFDIYDTRVAASTGKATKVFSDYCAEYFSGGWHWVLDFPFESSHRSKALLIEAIHMLDMAFFDWPRLCCCGCC